MQQRPAVTASPSLPTLTPDLEPPIGLRHLSGGAHRSSMAVIRELSSIRRRHHVRIPIFPSRQRAALLGLAATGAASMALSACTTRRRNVGYDTPPSRCRRPDVNASYGDYATMYGPVVRRGLSRSRPCRSRRSTAQFLRQIVRRSDRRAPGTIVVDTSAHFLYLVLRQRPGDALRRRPRPRRLRVVRPRRSSSGSRSGRNGRRRTR